MSTSEQHLNTKFLGNFVNSDDNQAIIAQCTPQGSGAIALLRLSGSNALTIATQISSLASQQKINALPTHTIHYGWIVDSQGIHLDQVMFLIMHGPRTFTGQDTVEITCHNNPFIIQAIVEQAIAAGARLADNGEFTRRAVLNNKIDLIQAEAINELIHANTQMALKKSLAQLEGSFSFWVADIEKNLTTALAFSEASFEFIDEAMSFDTQIKDIITQALHTIATIKKTFDQQQQIRQGVRIAIIGSVNAGKSSLFNALLGKNRAIVTNIAGTTRDVIEAGVYRAHNYWTLIDTAGLRQSEDVIEQEGISRSLEQAQLADVILLVFDGSRLATIQEQEAYSIITQKYAHKIILVRNKADLLIPCNPPQNTSNKQEENNAVPRYPTTPTGSEGHSNSSQIFPIAPSDSESHEGSYRGVGMPGEKKYSGESEEEEGNTQNKERNSLIRASRVFFECNEKNSLPFEAGQQSWMRSRVTRDGHIISVSSKNATNIQLLEQQIEQKIATLLGEAESPFLLNKRQFNLLIAIEHELTIIASMIDGQTTQHELLSYHLIDAIKHISELTGKTVSENGMDAVFREFCVGK